MAPGREFYDAQEAKINQAHERFKAEASSFSKCEQAGGSKDEQINRLDACHQAAREFFRELNDAVADPGPLTGKLFEQWRQNCLASAVNVLSGLPRNQESMRKHRDRLGIPATNFEFSPAVFENMQGIVACERPSEAKRLRDEFHSVGLPTGGFDRPRKIEPIEEERDSNMSTKTDNPMPPKREDPPKSSALSILTPAGAVEAARKAHPAFKFGIVVLGLAGVVTIGLHYGPSPETLVFGIIVVVVLMVLFFVFSQAVSMAHAGTPFSLQVQVLVWSYLIFAIVTPALLLSSAFIDKPLHIKTWIENRMKTVQKLPSQGNSGLAPEPPLGAVSESGLDGSVPDEFTKDAEFHKQLEYKAEWFDGVGTNRPDRIVTVFFETAETNGTGFVKVQAIIFPPSATGPIRFRPYSSNSKGGSATQAVFQLQGGKPRRLTADKSGNGYSVSADLANGRILGVVASYPGCLVSGRAGMSGTMAEWRDWHQVEVSDYAHLKPIRFIFATGTPNYGISILKRYETGATTGRELWFVPTSQTQGTEDELHAAIEKDLKELAQLGAQEFRGSPQSEAFKALAAVDKLKGAAVNWAIDISSGESNDVFYVTQSFTPSNSPPPCHSVK